MSDITHQSIKNALITYIGFGIGAINTLFLYTYILGDTYFGLVGFILSTANIVMPLMAFGVHNTLVKFYAQYTSEQEKSQFLTFVLFLPLLFILPFSFFGFYFYDTIAHLLSIKNPIIYDYLWTIPLIALFMGYFEIFYAWVKVHFKSVFGSFLKEVALRLFMSFGLLLVYLKAISSIQFIYTTILAYFVIMLLMKIYAFRVKLPSFNFKLPLNAKAVTEYSLYIILSGSIAMLLLDIDKFMLAQYIKIENIAYYSVAIFICLVIAVPGRAMHQITYPITAKLMAENKHEALNELYKKTSSTLQVVGGFVFLAILININQMYLLLPSQYSGGVSIVFCIGFSKYLDLVLGNNNSIIFNSKYYKMVLFLGILLAVLMVGLNMIFIPKYGINGAAIATLLAVTVYSWAKWYFVVKKMNLYPFTIKTAQSFGLLVLFFVSFYFWDFYFHPLINIALKLILFVPTYLYFNYLLEISSDINAILDRYKKYLPKRK